MEFEFLTRAIALAKVFAYKCAEGRKLIELAGGPEVIFSTGRKGLKEMMPRGDELIDRILDPGTLTWAQQELDWNIRFGIRPLYYEDPDYPARLRECYDAPIVLFCKGGADLNPPRTLAVVGTRRATFQGKSACANIVRELAGLEKPPVIVSGLAFGIDATAHRTALECGMKTIAVLPTGLDGIYPPQHRDLALQIMENGALVTDFPRSSYPQVAHFIRRNRIIAGMSDATLLAESFAKGGGLITTGLANSYDREVFAVPGRPCDASFEGCNNLIAGNVAHLATDSERISSVMGWSDRIKRGAREDPTLAFPEGSDRRVVLDLLKTNSPMDFEEILSLSGIPFNELTPLLLEMELEGRIIMVQGRRYALRQ